MNQGKKLLAVVMGLMMSGCAMTGLHADKSTGMLALYMDVDPDAKKPLPCRAIALRMNKVTDAINTNAVWSAESFFDIDNQVAIIPDIQDGKYVIDEMRCFARTHYLFDNYAQYFDIPTFETVDIYQGKITLSAQAFKTWYLADKAKRFHIRMTDAGRLKQDKLAEALRANQSLADWELVRE